MTGTRLLIVEDDADLRTTLVRGLDEEGFQVVGVATGEAFIKSLARSKPEVLIIDIGLPDTDGRDLCQALRARGVETPVLFLTARDRLTDLLSGFGSGGDDYLAKPFAFAELVARLRSLAKRSQSDRPSPASGIRLDPVGHVVASGGSEVQLTPTEFRLLALLLSRTGEVVRRSELMETGWSRGALVHGNSLDAYMARLRRKLAKLQSAPPIATVYGVGYSIR